MNTGILYGIASFVIWGLYPLYWKELPNVSNSQLIAHRVVWSFFLMAFILSCKREWPAFLRAMTWRIVAIHTVSAALVLVYWFTFVWSINAGYIVESSLGYFLNPLLNVVFGVFVFKESLRRYQWVSIALAFAGVLVVAVAYGKFPWVAFTIAVSFALYGLIKKFAHLNSIHGLMLEITILFPPALAYLIVVECQGAGSFGHVDALSNVLLVGGGIVTIGPLLFFCFAAQSIDLSLLGILQYIAPSLQFVLAVFLYHEQLSLAQLIGFILVWSALVVYTAEGIWDHKSQHKRTVAVAPDVVMTPVGSCDSMSDYDQV